MCGALQKLCNSSCAYHQRWQREIYSCCLDAATLFSNVENRARCRWSSHCSACCHCHGSGQQVWLRLAHLHAWQAQCGRCIGLLVILVTACGAARNRPPLPMEQALGTNTTALAWIATCIRRMRPQLLASCSWAAQRMLTLLSSGRSARRVAATSSCCVPVARELLLRRRAAAIVVEWMLGLLQQPCRQRYPAYCSDAYNPYIWDLANGRLNTVTTIIVSSTEAASQVCEAHARVVGRATAGSEHLKRVYR